MMQKTLDWLLEKSKVKRPVEDPNAPRYGDMLDRGVAAGIDIYLLYLVFANIFEWMSHRFYAHIDQELLVQGRMQDRLSEALPYFLESGLFTMWTLNTVVQLAIIGLFLVGSQVAFGFTPGKWIMGLRVVDRRTLQAPASWQYVVRYFGYIVASVPLMLGIMWANFNKQHRGWHDMLARTVVIQIRPKGWYWQQVKRAALWLNNRVRGTKP